MSNTYHHGDLRRALLVAAEAELAEKGTERFTLRACAKRAGVSHAAPAHHFGDVEGLLSALAADGFRRFAEMASERLQACADASPPKRLNVLGVGYVDFARANPALFKLMFASDIPDFDDKELRSAAEASFSQLAAAVGDATGTDPLASHDGQLRVATMWSMVHGLSHLILARRMRFLNERDETELQADIAAIISAVALVR
ncbi:TetR/AcrR family transcriptional regulator [Mesorhizobium sp. CAU 1741]|uniref:TetR/AcrR family transcriptional regulator n=1 Tax=Mesorhizobium sp. CAU 1741 TaxID=3140366 RepID=UPI00325C24C9